METKTLSKVTGDLETVIKTKADKSEIVNLHDIKSNKEDTEMSMRNIDILHK